LHSLISFIGPSMTCLVHDDDVSRSIRMLMITTASGSLDSWTFILPSHQARWWHHPSLGLWARNGLGCYVEIAVCFDYFYPRPILDSSQMDSGLALLIAGCCERGFGSNCQAADATAQTCGERLTALRIFISRPSY
jgi:hypothetical protein